MDALSPAQVATDRALAETGLDAAPREMQRLTRQVARRLTPGGEARIEPDAFREALCVVRRKGWATQLMNVTRRAGEVWIDKPDMEAAAARTIDPTADEYALRATLDGVVFERLRTLGQNAQDAFDTVQADLVDSGHVLSPRQLDLLARAVGTAFGVDDDTLARSALARQEADTAARAEIETRAAERRAAENARISAWEQSLVSFDAVPRILHCSPREALRWIAENRLPVTRRVPRPDGTEDFQFDPVELKRLRTQLPLWRGVTPDAKPGRRGGADLLSLVPETGSAGNAAVARVAALDRYAAHFRTARALNRRITLVTGPTNSGKSYTALNALAEAESGLALAPLRLLAHEFREALAARGVAASLATGEERITVPGSRHLAATVEMCPLHNPVDVAIIDEAQMLADPDRGAAWTAAIMGAPARHLFVLGAADCVPLVRRIAELCGDPVDEISLERKSPLRAASATIRLHELRPGDALIAFSRREVLDLRAELLTRGRRIAVVYGALSPEVRRAEAQRFNSGDADILVATDAIGMGLNLSIKRVIFTSLRKFDGTQTRDLTTQEIKQIGGRAGRYGLHEDGIVGVLANAGSPNFIRAMLHAPPEPITELRPLVQPDADIVRAVADEIGSESLYGVLARIKRAVLRPDDPNYRLADMEQAVAIAANLEGVDGLDLSQRWTYAMCPVDERDNGIVRLTHWASDHAAGRRVQPPGTGHLVAPSQASRQELERAEKRHKRLVAWRWMAQRFPETYAAIDDAEANTATLNDWIEAVLRQHSRGREHREDSRAPRSGPRKSGGRDRSSRRRG